MKLRTLVIATLAVAVPVLASSQLPHPWFLAGSSASQYDSGIENTREARALFVRSHRDSVQGFATIMQTFPAEEFRGRRMGLTAQVQVKGVTQWAGLWMRVDGPGNPPSPLAFDNMQSRPIKGTQGWKTYEVILDVPREAEEISIGVLLHGPGALWMTAVEFEPARAGQKPTVPIKNQ